jgi:hypothetical protein
MNYKGENFGRESGRLKGSFWFLFVFRVLGMGLAPWRLVGDGVFPGGGGLAPEWRALISWTWIAAL